MEIIYTKNNKNIIEYLNDIESARARYNLLLKEYGNSISAIFLTTSLGQPNSMDILPDILEESIGMENSFKPMPFKGFVLLK